MNIAVIGAGVSGIAAANVLQKHGHSVVIYEKLDNIGGVWALSYPEVRLQNTWRQYALADFPWPFTPDLHPTAAQIQRYLHEAVNQLNLKVCMQHEVTRLTERANGWEVEIKHPGGTTTQHYDYVVLAVGQYTEGKYFPQFPNQEQFQGKVVSERDVRDLEVFRGKRVAVVGFGKSALDMATLATEHGAEVHHVFRTPRWTFPKYVLGLHFAHPFFARVSSVMMTSWAHPSGFERFLHKSLPFMVNGFWGMMERIFWHEHTRPARGIGADAVKRLQILKPKHKLVPDLRSAGALAPDNYYRYVAEGKITPHLGTIAGFTERELALAGGETVPCDIVVLSLGSKTPTYPFMPAQYRELMERENDGVQLYRHLVHPRIPNMGFAGFNHGFMHIPAVEVATVWLCALLDGKLKLPSVEAMEASIERIRTWKRAYIHYEPSRSMGVNTRYQQYIDILLKDLRLSPYRKGINVLAESFGGYGSRDYRHVLTEYRQRSANGAVMQPLELDT